MLMKMSFKYSKQKKVISQNCFLLFSTLLGFLLLQSQTKKITHQKLNFDEMELLCKRSPNKGYLLAKNAYAESLTIKNDEKKAQSLYFLGNSVGNMNKYSEALKYLYYAKSESEKVNNDKLTLYCDFSIAVQYGRLNFNRKAIDIIDTCFEKTHFIENADSKNLFIANLYSFKAFFLVVTKVEPSY